MMHPTWRLGTILAVVCSWLVPLAAQQPPRILPHPPSAGPTTIVDSFKEVVAVVNGQPITKAELAEELIQRRGKQQLQLLINRKIIEQACAKAGITVTDKEVEEELRELMHANGFTTASEFEKQMVRPMMQMTLVDYKEDVLRQGLLTRKLAGKRVSVTDEDLQQAFESRFGEKVQCRIIVEKSLKIAQDMYVKIGNNRINFLQVARQQADKNLASSAGQINPFGRYTTFDALEKRAFELQDGEISEVIQVPEGGYVIILREGVIPADTTKKLDDVRAELTREVLERKTKQVVPALVAELKNQADVQDYLNNKFDIIRATMIRDQQNAPDKK